MSRERVRTELISKAIAPNHQSRMVCSDIHSTWIPFVLSILHGFSNV